MSVQVQNPIHRVAKNLIQEVIAIDLIKNQKKTIAIDQVQNQGTVLPL